MKHVPLLKSVPLALAAAFDGARAGETQSVPSSLLRGSEPSQLVDVNAETGNKCANRANPLNCIDCRVTNTDQCNANTDYTVPYSCSEGQGLCCTVSNIDETDDFGPKFGTCKKSASGGSGQRDAGRGPSDCVADGDPVFMDLYKGPYGPQVDTSIEDFCCSGSCISCSCISGAWPDGTGRTLYSGSCEGVCGSEGTTTPSKSSFLDVDTEGGCADGDDPLNCIDCRTGNEVCDGDGEHSVQYGCSRGQSLCCSVSNIEETSFGDEFGDCKKDSIVAGVPFKSN